ncbi:tetratricopeptide repeat protein [Streptomyces griseoloalbus]|uniref:tetratricopeptide repeat protein n=1 Tax=Streptomyces griseoloalbus TaxID=67303 RepID=UPI0033AAA99D
MARLSRETKREQQQAAHAANLAAAPIDVHVPVAGEGVGGALVGGLRVIAGPGEEIQQAVLNRLHRIAVASGHAVVATVHDERIGYVVPLQVDPDGSSRFTAQPVLMAAPQDREPGRGDEPAPARTPGADRPTHLLRPVPEQQAPANPQGPAEPQTPAEPQASPESQASAEPQRPLEPQASPEPQAPPEPQAEPDIVRDSTPTFKLRPLPEARAPRDAVPTFRLRAVPESAEVTPPGTVAPPTGEFGPPPPMDARPHPGSGTHRPRTRTHDAERSPEPEPMLDPDPKPTPPRGFDAVAEAVLGDEPLAASGEHHLAEPMARVNDAVRAGRLDTAARLAEETVTEASATLGPEHPEVLRLRELTAYIAYLAGEPLRAFRLSMDLAVICRRAGDAEAAYGNVRSAATAWRAVRDPLLGLELGHELIALWTALTTDDGPAADEIEELESARARMGRLTERARAE